jgi:hypothetical protein
VKKRRNHSLSNVVNKLLPGKKYPKLVATSSFFKKAAQSKQSPNRRKFAQSGHMLQHLSQHSAMLYG